MTDDRYAGIVHGQSQRAGLQVERRRSERDRVTIGYEVEYFDFETRRPVLQHAAYATDIHALTAGWAHDISRRASVTLRGGPRLVDGSVAAEIDAALRARLKTADLSVNYTQTQTALVGIAGVADAQTLGASQLQVVFKVLVPLALPDIYNSLRHLFGLAFGYIMLAELINAQHGLGYLLMSSQRRGLSEHIILILIIIGLLAYGIDRVLFFFQRGLFPYRVIED